MAKHVLDLANNVQLRKELGFSARETIRSRFSIEVETETHAQLYTESVKNMSVFT